MEAATKALSDALARRQEIADLLVESRAAVEAAGGKGGGAVRAPRRAPSTRETGGSGVQRASEGAALRLRASGPRARSPAR